MQGASYGDSVSPLPPAVQLNGNRGVMGVLRGFDQFMNLVLDGTVDTKTKADIGMVVGTPHLPCVCRPGRTGISLHTAPCVVLVCSMMYYRAHGQISNGCGKARDRGLKCLLQVVRGNSIVSIEALDGA